MATENSASVSTQTDDDLNQADLAATEGFCAQASASSSSATCDEKPQSSKPCDLYDFELVETKGARTKAYRLQDFSFVEDTPDRSKQRSVAFSQDDQRQKTLEVLGDREGSKHEPTTIDIKATPLAACDDSFHPKLVIRQPNGVQDVFRGSAATEKISVPVYRATYGVDQAGGPAGAYLLEKYWPLSVPVQSYYFDVETCGVRDEDTPIDACHYQVDVYPSEQYTFKLKVPPFKKKVYERSKTRSVGKDGGVERKISETETRRDGATDGWSVSSKVGRDPNDRTVSMSRTLTHKDGSVHSYEETTGQKGGDLYHAESKTTKAGDKVTKETDATDQEGGPAITESSEPPVDKVTFELNINGIASDSTVAINQILNTLKYIDYSFKQVLNLIKRAPQLGFKFTTDVSFFSGEVAFTWGYKEHTDHQVFFAWGAAIDVQLWAGSVTVSFGVSGSVVEGVIEGSIGGTIGAYGKVQRDAPTQPLMPSEGAIGVTGSVKFKAEGRAVAGVSYWKFEYAAGVEAAFTAKVGLKVDRKLGLHIETTGGFAKTILYLREIEGTGDEEKTPYTLFNEAKLWDTTFPKGTEADPADDPKFKDMVKA